MNKVLLVLVTILTLSSCKKDLVDPTKNEIADASSLEQFQSEVSEGTSMVFFHAAWCSNCEELRPTVEKIAGSEDLQDVKFLEVDYDETRDVFKEYEVEGFPQLLFFKNGAEQERLVGKNQTEAGILATLNKYR